MMRRLLVLFGLLALAPAAHAQQLTDSTYVPAVAHPAYTDQHPLVLIDEGHANSFTADGRGLPFAKLLQADGYRVLRSPQPFSAPLLSMARAIVVVNGINHIGDRVFPNLPAFSQDELKVLGNWLEEGGSLLLVAEQAPFGAAAEGLAKYLNVTLSNRPVIDPEHVDARSNNPGCLLFDRAQGLIGDHAITRGRDSSETVHRVVTWTGASIEGPSNASVLLKLSGAARELADGDTVSPAGSAQAIAFTRGHGRVVVLGDAAMLTAQLAPMAGAPALPMGINRTDLDDAQFALNAMHWLTDALEPRPAIHKPAPKPLKSSARGARPATRAARAPR